MAKRAVKKAAKKPAKKAAKKKSKKPANKSAPAIPDASNDAGFTVEEDGLVDIRLQLTFAEDAEIRVLPEIAKRIMEGEFDGQDPGDIPGVDMADVLNTARIEVESAYEGRPPKPSESTPRPPASDDLPFDSGPGYDVEEDEDEDDGGDPIDEELNLS